MLYPVVLPLFYLVTPLSFLCLLASPAPLFHLLWFRWIFRKSHLSLLLCCCLFSFLLIQPQPCIFAQCTDIPQHYRDPWREWVSVHRGSQNVCEIGWLREKQIV